MKYSLPSFLSDRPDARAEWPRRLSIAMLVSVLAAGCDEPIQPFQESDAAFSMIGFLDLYADTQWVRVMPVRRNLFLDPEAVDAVVTLEHVSSGRVVTLNDSLVSFRDDELGAVAYVSNYWTTERLEPGAEYRVKALRSDGASTTARVVVPADVEITFRNDVRFAGGFVGALQVRGEYVPYVDVLYLLRHIMGGGIVEVTVPQTETFVTGDPALHGFGIGASHLQREGWTDVRRRELRIVVGPSDWPYHLDISDLEFSLPGTIPSNVEGGYGFVGGVAKWTIPFHSCEIVEPRPDRVESCEITYNATTASLAGRVLRQPCGDPYVLRDVRLVERFPNGGTIIRHWKTGVDGEYRFEGIEPGTGLVLEIGAGTPSVHLPQLGPGQRYEVEDLLGGASC